MTPQNKDRLEKANFFRENGRHEEAMRLCNEVLNENIDQPEALFIIGHCLIEVGKHGLAHALFMQFLRIKPNNGPGWNNLGKCYLEVNMLEEAERCFRRGIKIEKDNPYALANMGLVHLHRCEPEKAIEYCLDALKLYPQFITCQYTLGLAHLMLRQWDKGWSHYNKNVGFHPDRIVRVYGDEQEWDGTKDQVVVAFGEQGLGDEISFASCIPDLINDSKEVVIECNARLHGLFKRSFPKAHVYGTRHSDVIDWANKHVIEARVSFGQLNQFYRNTAEDFHGKPYLAADPERRLQWRALLDSLGDKPKIGISWQGGIKRTGRERRSVSLESMLPILRQDATFVSLQYKEARNDIEAMEAEHGIKVYHWPNAVEAIDYDETAALVAELDMVISVTTAVIHLSGALGVPCLVLTPLHPIWRYGLDGEQLPGYKSVTLLRQRKRKDWIDPINEAAVRLRTFINGKQNGYSDLCGPEQRHLRTA